MWDELAAVDSGNQFRTTTIGEGGTKLR